jgi:hypothetical protein
VAFQSFVVLVFIWLGDGSRLNKSRLHDLGVPYHHCYRVSSPLLVEFISGKDWYSVGNTEYDVDTLRFKDFIWLISFGLCTYLLWLWVTIIFEFSKNSRLM